MGAGVSKEVIARASYRERVKFANALRRLVPVINVASEEGCTRVDVAGGAYANLTLKVIRASNGEACGWVTAVVYDRYGKAVESWWDAPWMGGANPEKVACALRYYSEPANCWKGA